MSATPDRESRLRVEILVRDLRHAVLGAGLATGLVGALWLARALEGLLYGVGAFDPGVLLSVVGLLAAVVVAASLVPARRATRVDPVVALAAE